jgi:hypothetical protein
MSLTAAISCGIADDISTVQATQLLTKALRTLCEEDEATVLAFLLERAPMSPGSYSMLPARSLTLDVYRDPAAWGAAGLAAKGPLRTIPFRLPEPLYERLKHWSEENGFPMAVIVRGLIERFLDDQEARAA